MKGASHLSIQPSPSSDFAKRFPGLHGLARDVLNADWDFEYASAEDAVVSFASQFPRDVASCIAGIDALLTECPDEAARDRELDALGWGYGPRPGKLDAFLVWARDTLSSRATETAAG
jgi:hypothetical protein